MNIAEMQEKLKEIGVTRAFPMWHHETTTIELKTRKPVSIEGGVMSGCEIVVFGDAFKVWTSQKNKAMRIAREKGWKIVELDGEAELIVPAGNLDTLISLGLRQKRKVSDAQRQQLAKMRLKAQGIGAED